MAAVSMAKAYPDFVVGFICQHRLVDVSGPAQFVHMTPGVQLDAAGDKLGQQYSTPYDVIAVHKSDVIIVGRGVYHSKQPAVEAERYRCAGWNAYLSRI